MTTAVVLTAVAGPARSASRQAPDREDLPAVDDQSVFLIRDPSVQAELRLSKEQIQTIQALTDEADGPLWTMRDGPPTEEHRPRVELLTRVNGALGRALGPKQKDRLDQIVLQAQGAAALARSEVADKLSLSQYQRRRVRRIIAETRRAARGVIKAARTTKTRATLETTLRKLQIKQHRRLVKILSHPQKRQWLSLMGKPFDLSQLGPPAMKAPELQAVETWINSQPLTLAQLRGKVVVLHFWTFGCINCVHNYPAYKDWQQRFAGKDVTIVGIHTPESQGERNVEAIRQKMKDNGLKFPVAVDNEKRNWKAWANNIWPAVYLIDKKGYVRHWWYGELNWKKGDILLFCRGTGFASWVCALARPATRAERGLDAEPNSRPAAPCLAPPRGAPVDALTHRSQLLVRHRAVHLTDPSPRPIHRAVVQKRRAVFLALAAPPQTRPRPGLSPSHQSGPERIPLDVSQDRPEMRVLLDWERLEPALPDVSASAVVSMISSDVRRHHPLHPTTQVAVLSRPQHHVEVIGHQTVRKHPHRQPVQRIRQQPYERLVVLARVEDLRAGVPTIDHVVTNAPHRSPGSPWHAPTLRNQPAGVNEKVECPLFLLPARIGWGMVRDSRGSVWRCCLWRR